MNTATNPVVNADPHGRITLQGHDPVAFHTEGKAIKGGPTLATEHRGYTYWFSSEKNKTAFEAQPEMYLPAYGGYCAYGVSLGVLAPVDIGTWEIVDGRLMLQFSPATKEKLDQSRDTCIAAADDNWARIEIERQRSVTI